MEIIEGIPYTPPPMKEDIELWLHQREAISKAKPRNYFGLFFDPGTGKTRTVLEILLEKYSKRNRQVLPTLILCPPVVIQNWKDEFLKYTDIEESRIITLTGSGKQRLETFTESDPESVFITNYETLNMDIFDHFTRWMHTSPQPVCMVLDEMHKIKDPTSKRAKLAHTLARIAHYRYGLTGTPILNSLMDVFSQFLFLDLGERFGDNFFTFRLRFFRDRNKGMPSHKHFPDWVPLPGSSQKIKDLIAPVTMTADKSQCLDLPPFVKKTVYVEMGKDQARLYQEMKNDFLTSLEVSDGSMRTSIAELAITKALRLQQIVSGHLRVEAEASGGEVATLKIKDNPRKKALHELLEDLAPYHKVIVWAVFKDNYEDIRDVCDKLGLQYAELHGSVKDRDAQIEMFNHSPRCRVLIGHPGSGGIGVNLVAASYSIFYSRNFSLEFDIQAEARNYRGGSNIHEKITRIDLCCRDTIDELVMIALANKVSISDKVLRDNVGNL